MRIVVFVCFLTISLNGQTTKQSNVSSSSSNTTTLSTIIQDLAPIARLINGIAIIQANPNKTNEIVAELLGVGSGDKLAQLKELKGLTRELGDVYELVEQFPGWSIEDIPRLKDLMEELEKMKPHVKLLKDGVKDDVSKEVKAVNDDKTLDDNSWSGIKGIVDKIRGGDGISEGANSATQKLKDLNSYIQSAQDKIPIYKDYLTKFEKVFKLGGIREKIKDVEELGSFIRHYRDNADGFKALNADLTMLKGDVSNLNNVLKTLLAQLLAGIQKSLDWIDGVSKISQPLKTLTIGLPNGIEDLKLLLDDMKLNRSLSPIGKDLERIATLLKPLANFYEDLEIVKSSWADLLGDRSWQTLITIKDLLSSALKHPRNPSLATDIEKVAKCVEALQPPTDTFDESRLAEIAKFFDEVSESLNVFNETMSTLRSLVTEEGFQTQLDFVKAKANETSGKSSDPGSIKVWDEIREWNELDAFSSTIEKLMRAVNRGAANSPFHRIAKPPDFGELAKVGNSFDGTNLPGALSCLQNTPYNTDDIDKMISFGNDIIALGKLQVQPVKDYLTKFVTVRDKISSLAKVFKKSASERALELKNSESVSRDLGNGVQALRDYVRILELQGHVRWAVHANVKLKDLVDAIPGAKSVWTNDNRKLMGEMITDLEALDKKVGAIDKTNISTLWMVFEEAGQVKGVEIDAKVFADPIARVLKAGRSKAIQRVGNEFMELGTLNLNFAKHHVDLKAALLTMGPLQKFFDDFFADNVPATTSPVTMTTTEEPQTSNSWIYFVGGGVLVGFGALGGAGFLRRRRKEKEALRKRRFNPERYWVYHTPTCNPSDLNWLPIACASGKLDVISKLIAQGQNVNTYHNGRSCLHIAVSLCDTNLIDLLIRSGFDQTLRDMNDRTAEEFLKNVQKQDNKKKENLDYQRAEECLKTWKGVKQFEQYIPPLPSSNTFSIHIHDDLVVDFTYRHGSLTWQEGSATKTHNAVRCDEDGMFDIDKLCITKEKDRDGEEHERIDRVRRRKLVNLVFEFALLVDVKWIEEILRVGGGKAFFLDYEKYRVTKVKYAGEIFDSVDLWRKWACHRAVPALQFVVLYFHCAENTKPETMIGKTLGATVAEKCSDAIQHASKKNPTPPYWFKDLKPTFFVTVDGPESDDWLMNKEALKNENTCFSEEGYYKWLLSRNGVGKGELDEVEQERKRMQMKGYREWKDERMDRVMDEEESGDKRKKGDKKSTKSQSSQSVHNNSTPDETFV